MNNFPEITLSLPGGWETILEQPGRERLEALLPAFFRNCRWFGGKARTIKQIAITDALPMPGRKTPTGLLICRVIYTDNQVEDYLLPLSSTSGANARLISSRHPGAILAHTGSGQSKGILFDGARDPVFMKNCFDFIARSKHAAGARGTLAALPGRALLSFINTGQKPPEPHRLQKEQSNTSFLYGHLFILKLYRRLAEGIHPEVEMNRFLTEKTTFNNIAHFAGLIELHSSGDRKTAIGLLQSFVEHESDAWTYSLEAVNRYLKNAPLGLTPPLSLPQVPDAFSQWAGEKYLEEIELLGRRTAQLHRALASDPGDPAFSPEPFTLSYQESLYLSMLSLVKQAFRSLRETMERLPPETREEVAGLLSVEASILGRLRRIEMSKVSGMKIRIHGDYHLGQILCTGDDFVIIDFEGEPARPPAERRRKRSPLVDVAGMIRSFHYAAYGAIFLRDAADPEEVALLSPWAELWQRTISKIFLSSYLGTMRESPGLLPETTAELNLMLEAYLLEKAVYELYYELNNRPDWVIIPLRGLRNLMNL
ncbi:MAG: putative maltokinase [Candidatus Euphemobacter frigidus]|nr:putative maltokinase [Candidatus Euphemobacter frigidus]MDP8276459.1 putative maltokinase [Candidatus Euphemobacter frigidus]